MKTFVIRLINNRCSLPVPISYKNSIPEHYY